MRLVNTRDANAPGATRAWKHAGGSLNKLSQECQASNQDMEALTGVEWLALLGAGIAAGFINSVAGGGSFLTLPALMLLGLPADVANGTNRVGVFAQSVTGSITFHRAGVMSAQEILPTLIPCGLGALAGSVAAALTPDGVLKPVLLTSLVAMAAWVALRPQSFSDGGKTRLAHPRARLYGHVTLFLAGVYGGFVQAGVGFILLGAFAGVMGHGLAKANALKMVCTALFAGISLVVFSVADQIEWLPGLCLGGATIVGTQLGVRFAMKAPAQWMRWILLSTVLVSCAAAFLKD